MDKPAASPTDAHYWTDLVFDPETDTIDRRITLHGAFVRALAAFVGESTSFQEAIRMAVSQGTMLLQAGSAHGWTSPPEKQDIPEPAVQWWSDDVEELSKSVTFTREQCEQIALAAPEFLTFQEAVRRCVNVALAERDNMR
jgi:hypothetical protein